MFRVLFVTTLLFTFSAIAFAQNKSVYTSLKDSDCKITESKDEMPGNYSGRCGGVAGYKLNVYLDDERNSVGVVLPSKKTVGLDLWNYFSAFSALGDNAEWRMKGRQPVGLIVRLNVSDKGDGTKPTSYLVVAKISKTNACVTDVIKPGKDQNTLARRAADKSAAKPCKAKN